MEITPKRDPRATAVKIPHAAMPSTGRRVARRASASPGSLKQAMTNASAASSFDATNRAIGAATSRTWASVSIPGGPSARVTHSMSGPPPRRNGPTAASMPSVTASVEFGFRTTIRTAALPEFTGSVRRLTDGDYSPCACRVESVAPGASGAEPGSRADRDVARRWKGEPAKFSMNRRRRIFKRSAGRATANSF